MTGNLQATAEHKLAHFDLLHRLKGVFGGDFDAHRDDLARRAAERLGQDHGPQILDRLVVIGDTPHDIRCGQAIGAQVVAVCTGYHDRVELESAGPTHLFDDLSDVDHLFRLLTETD
jgi:phosphoglycolate phosphatase